MDRYLLPAIPAFPTSMWVTPPPVPNRQISLKEPLTESARSRLCLKCSRTRRSVQPTLQGAFSRYAIHLVAGYVVSCAYAGEGALGHCEGLQRLTMNDFAPQDAVPRFDQRFLKMALRLNRLSNKLYGRIRDHPERFSAYLRQIDLAADPTHP